MIEVIAVELDPIEEVAELIPGTTGPPGLTWIDSGWAVAMGDLAINNAVEHGGSSYRASVAHTAAADTEPGVGANWATVWAYVAQAPPAASGDMLAATYDPGSKAGDAFDMDNMVEGADSKILTAAERVAIDNNSSKVTFPEADVDGKLYARKDGAWVEVAAGGGGGGMWELVGAPLTLVAAQTSIDYSALDGTAYRYRLRLDVPYGFGVMQGRPDGVDANGAAGWNNAQRRDYQGNSTAYTSKNYCDLSGFLGSAYAGTVDVYFGSLDITDYTGSNWNWLNYIKSELSLHKTGTAYDVVVTWNGISSAALTSFLLNIAAPGLPIGTKLRLYRTAI